MTIVQIYGTERSGSTLLENYLAKNIEHSSSLGEVMFFSFPFKREHFDVICACGNKGCSVIKDKARRIKGFRFEFQGMNIFDSSKNIYWHHRVATENSQRAKIVRILIIKKPSEFIRSKRKRGENKYFIKYVFYNLVVGFGCKIDLVVALEDLVNFPDAILGKVQKLVGATVCSNSLSSDVGHHFFASSTIKKIGITPVRNNSQGNDPSSEYFGQIAVMSFVYKIVLKYGGDWGYFRLLEKMFGLLFWKAMQK